MNRLELCKMTRQLAGIPGTGPTTTIGQTGESKRVVDWVDMAWAEIQRIGKWDFLWEAATVVVTAGTNTTTGTIPAHRYEKDSVYDAFGAPLTYCPWVEFRQSYPLALIAAGTPGIWTIRPDLAFAVDSKPTANTTYTVERYKNPVAMTADADTPAIPTEHHMAIVYKALLLYANFEEAGITRATAEEEYSRHLNAMQRLLLPDLIEAGALC